MESPSADVLKLPDLIMCGDHSSFTKTELNVKDVNSEERAKEKPRERIPTSFPRISPTSSRTERPLPEPAARRRVRSLDALQRPDLDLASPANRALMQAALGSFRWPPYLLGVWVVVLIVTHLLHCLVGLLERALPNVRKLCECCRGWTERAWAAPAGRAGRARRAALALLTGALYAAYAAVYAAHAAAVWAVEPLCADDDKAGPEAPLADYVSSRTDVLKL